MQLLVGQHQPALIGEEELEAGDPVLADQARHGVGKTRAPPRYGHVEAVVDRSLARALVPDRQRVQRRLSRLGTDEIENGGGAAGRRRRRAAKEVVRHHGAHHRQLHVGVRVDAAGHDVAAASLDDRGAGRRFEPLAQGGDALVAAQQVDAAAPALRHHGAAADQCRRHRALRRMPQVPPRRSGWSTAA